MKSDLYTVLYVMWRRKPQWIDIVDKFGDWFRKVDDEEVKLDFMSEKVKRCVGGFVTRRTIESIESKEAKSISAMCRLCVCVLYGKRFFCCEWMTEWVDRLSMMIVETTDDEFLREVMGLEGVASHLIRAVSSNMTDAVLVVFGCRAMWNLSTNHGESQLCCCFSCGGEMVLLS